MTRPLADIDWVDVEELAKAGCLGTEIAASYGIDPDTLYRRCETDLNMGFSKFLHQKRASGDRLLRKAQYELALEKDKAMLIWLGKQRLGQSEKNENVIKNPCGENFRTETINPDLMSKEERLDYLKKKINSQNNDLPQND